MTICRFKVVVVHKVIGRLDIGPCGLLDQKRVLATRKRFQCSSKLQFIYTRARMLVVLIDNRKAPTEICHRQYFPKGKSRLACVVKDEQDDCLK